MSEKITEFPGKKKKDPDQVALDEQLASLQRSIEAGSDNRESLEFETETGFKATVFFYKDGSTNLHLHDNIHTSIFFIENNEVQLRELRGPDGELVDRSEHSQKHEMEATRLLAEGKLNRTEPTRPEAPTEQMGLDLGEIQSDPDSD